MIGGIIAEYFRYGGLGGPEMNAKRRALELSEHISHKKMELAQLSQYYRQEQQKYS